MQPRKCVTATVKGFPSPRLMRLNHAITFGATQTDTGVARQFSPGLGRVARELVPNLYAQNINLDRRCDPPHARQKLKRKIRQSRSRRQDRSQTEPANPSIRQGPLELYSAKVNGSIGTTGAGAAG
jgi:hypothetical protein